MQAFTSNGRSPCDKHRVIWLKLDKASTTAAMQSSNLQVFLARHGSRYGLRADVEIAEDVHRLHKSSVPYLDTPSVMRFVVGPFPFGARGMGSAVCLNNGVGMLVLPSQRDVLLMVSASNGKCMHRVPHHVKFTA